MDRKWKLSVLILIVVFVFLYFFNSSVRDKDKKSLIDDARKRIEGVEKKVGDLEKKVSEAEKKASEAVNRVSGSEGIAISFDDHSVKKWYMGRELFKKYGAKATFFVSNIDLLTKEEVNMLRELKEDGHEIGCHGLNHINAVNFLKNHTIDDYIQTEIEPSIKKMKAYGLSPRSFAYPYGAHTKELDLALIKKFDILRGTSYTHGDLKIKDLNLAYYSKEKDKNKNLVFAVGIDGVYNNSSEDVIEGIKRAQKNKEILILYGHCLGEATEEEKYATSMKMLEDILSYSSAQGLKFYTMDELNSVE